MFKTQKDLREFIIWAKANKIKRIRIKDIEVEISELSFVDNISPELADPESYKDITDFEKKVLVDTEEPNSAEDDEMLFWSAKK